ncbi:glycosyltransferase [Intrasporangium sp.]|uniref:glycosyltransferase n=1 Tax=Intrasporangium sp. TaxID=1925024 RepID=UPI003221478B
MRIALSKSTLLVPPTYFALAHAVALRDEFDFRFFTLAAMVTDRTVGVPVDDFVPVRRMAFRWRERLIPAAMPVMARAIVRYRPSVIHQHFATWSWPAVRAAHTAGVPLLTTLHGADVFTATRAADTAMRRWHHHNIRLACEQATLMLAVSSYLADVAVTAGFPSDRLQVHYQGIDTDLFTPGAGPEPARVLFVGSLSEHKGIRDLVRASTRLREQVPHELVVIGDGPLAGGLARAARDLPHVTMCGQLDRAGVLDQMRRASVMVVPSKESGGRREAAGLVLLEAQSCGTPVVAYASGGMPEMVDPESGLLVPEGDVDALTHAMSVMLSSDDLARAERGASARRFVIRERSLARSARELSGYYRLLAS